MSCPVAQCSRGRARSPLKQRHWEEDRLSVCSTVDTLPGSTTESETHSPSSSRAESVAPPSVAPSTEAPGTPRAESVAPAVAQPMQKEEKPEKAMQQADVKTASSPPSAASGSPLALGFAVAVTQMAGLTAETARLTCFHAVQPPGISIHDYVGRIQKFFNCSESCFVLALVYIDRLIKTRPDITVTPLSAHRLVVTAMVVAAKFQDDVFYANAHYAKIGGLRLLELNALEGRLCELLNWRLHVLPQEYAVYRNLCVAAARGAVAAAGAQ